MERKGKLEKRNTWGWRGAGYNKFMFVLMVFKISGTKQERVACVAHVQRAIAFVQSIRLCQNIPELYLNNHTSNSVNL